MADGWRGVTEAAPVPLTAEWREHVVEFIVREPFANGARLRFDLPDGGSGEFHLTDPHLRRTDGP